MNYLIKIGSALICKENTIDLLWLSKKVSEISALHKQGHNFILISSGSVAAGMEILGLTNRPTNPLELQLLSGQGQVKLIKYYKDFFMERGIYIAQVLLTHHNFVNKKETGTIKEILNAYLHNKVIPIINENDMVNKEEFDDDERLFTDNDILAALVAANIRVDKAIILTDVDGLYQGDPKNGTFTEIIKSVTNISEEIIQMASYGKSDLGLGGMKSKIQAADIITQAGIDTIIANGKYSLFDILSSKVPHTLFKSKTN